MSNATDMHKHETRMMLANSITSVLVYRFPWLRVNATADNALRAYLVETIVSKHDSGLTIESAMGAMLDALQAENAEVSGSLWPTSITMGHARGHYCKAGTCVPNRPSEGATTCLMTSTTAN